MPFVLKVLLTVIFGTALGLAATQMVIVRAFPFGAVVSGSWTAFPVVGAPAIDPYARAILARTALIPVGADEGIAFRATNDSGGRPLQGRCDYRLEGRDPAARFWTLGLYDPRGVPFADDTDHHALTSQNVLRLDGQVAITVAATVHGGNWLSAPQEGRFTLVYTLYEPNGGTALSAATDIAPPAIQRIGCAP